MDEINVVEAHWKLVEVHSDSAIMNHTGNGFDVSVMVISKLKIGCGQRQRPESITRWKTVSNSKRVCRFIGSYTRYSMGMIYKPGN